MKLNVRLQLLGFEIRHRARLLGYRWRLWSYHVCSDCGKVDRIAGFSVGRHINEDGWPHLPF